MTGTAIHPARLVPGAAQAWGLTLAWDLSVVAGRALPCARIGDHAVAIELKITPTGRGRRASARLSARLRSGDRVELRTLSDLPARWLREPGCEHVDVEGVVSCTCARGGHPTPVFARCPLLAQVGIPAGSYSLRTRS